MSLMRCLLGLSVVGAIGGCAGPSLTGVPKGSAPGGKTDTKPALEGGTPNGGGKTSDSVPAALSSPTTAAGSNYGVSPVVLSGEGPYGSGDGMLALASGKRTVKLRSDDGSDELTVTIDVEYNNYRPDRGEMWALVPAQRGSLPTYGVVPVRVDLTTADARVGFSIERAELVAAQPVRAAVEHVYGGPLTGSLGYDDFKKIDPPCSEVRLLLDFRTDEVRARLQFENGLNAVCKRWQTSAPPLPWGALLGS